MTGENNCPQSPFVVSSSFLVHCDSKHAVAPLLRALNRHNSVWKKVSKKSFRLKLFFRPCSLLSPHTNIPTTAVRHGIPFIPGSSPHSCPGYVVVMFYYLTLYPLPFLAADKEPDGRQWDSRVWRIGTSRGRRRRRSPFSLVSQTFARRFSAGPVRVLCLHTFWVKFAATGHNKAGKTDEGTCETKLGEKS